MFNQKMKFLTAIIFSLIIFAPVAQAQVCSPTPSGLVAWYPADGNANDISGNGNHGSLNNNTFAAGNVGQAFDINNLNGVTVADNAVFNQQSFTIEGWVTAAPYSCSPACGQFIAAKSGSNGLFGFDFGTFREGGPATGGALRFTINGGGPSGGDLIDDVSIADGSFHHVAASYDGSTMKIFLNGVLAAQKSLTTTINYETNSTFVIGSRQGALLSTQAYSGLIDELTFYNRALSDAEIAAIFNAGSAGKCKPVVTAASVSVSGRVLSPRGRGVSRAMVYLTDPEGYTRSTLTNHFGFYRFEAVEVGQTYIFNVFSKKYQFLPQVITISEETENLNFSPSP